MSIIDDPRVYRLWADAQSKPEWATRRLWGYIFKTKVFNGNDWAVLSRQPPTDDPHDGRRVDFIAEHRDNDGNWTRVLLIAAKHAKAGPEELAALEIEAFTACCAYLHYHRRNQICAMTSFGGKARLWVYQRGMNYLTPLVPAHGSGLGAEDGYIEANSAEGYTIVEGLKYIRDHRVPPADTLPSPSSPRPTNVALPPDWHGDEVPFVAGPSAQDDTLMTGLEYTAPVGESSGITYPPSVPAHALQSSTTTATSDVAGYNAPASSESATTTADQVAPYYVQAGSSKTEGKGKGKPL